MSAPFKDATNDAVQFLTKHGDLTRAAAYDAIRLLTGNGFVVTQTDILPSATDLSQAAVAAALEAAAVIAETHQVYQAHVCAARIRALITPAQLSAANARADQARDAALVEAKAAVGLVRVPVGSTGPIWDAMDAIDALRDKPAPAQCCMCGKTDLSTVEGDGGPECQLDDGRWTCSHACYDRATEEPAPAVTVGGGLCGCCGERPIAYPSEGECIDCFSANEGGEL